MVIYKLTNGTLADADEVMSNFNKINSNNILNKVRQTIDRTSVDSAGQDDIFSEAYVDSNGQNNTVDTSNTSAVYDSLSSIKYYPGVTDEASGDTTYDPNTFTNVSNAFDGDDTTYANINGSGSGGSWVLGKTFTAKTVKVVKVKYQVYSSSSGGNAVTVNLKTYNGTTWSSHTNLFTYNVSATSQTKTETRYIEIDSSVEGIQVEFNISTLSGSYYSRLYTLEYGDIASGLIEHTIPSGTYPSNVSKLIGKSFYEDWEEGATTQHRLENATENSGWINDGELGEFTAFTSEPTKYIVRLTPKTSSPTAGYPSIRGTGFYTE